MRAQSFPILLSGVAAIALCSALPAAASECTNTTYAGIYTEYPYQDLGQSGSEDPVAQGGHTLVCGKWKGDIWGSTGDTSTYRGAQEVDYTVGFADTLKATPIGPVQYEFTVAYYDFNTKGLGDSSDDAYDIHLDVARPFTVGTTTVSPFVRITHIGFTNGADGIDFVRPGLRIAGPITTKLSYSVEASTSMNQTWDVDTNRFQGDLNYDLGGGWNGNVRLKLTEGLDKPMVGGGVRYCW